MGSREYVNEVFAAFRGRFGPRRKEGARRMLGLESKLYVLRDLKRNLIGPLELGVRSQLDPDGGLISESIPGTAPPGVKVERGEARF